MDVADEQIDVTSRAVLGLTVSCARCHDHKFDPIPTKDYYALYGIFHSTRYPWPGIELEQQQRDLVPLVPEEEARRAKEVHETRRKELQERVESLEKEAKEAEGEAKKETPKV